MIKVCEYCNKDYIPGKFVYWKQKYCQDCIKSGVARKLSVKKYDNSDVAKQKRKEWLSNNRERSRLIKEKYHRSEKGKKKKREYFESHKEEIYKYLKNYSEVTKQRTISHQYYKIHIGKKICFVCGSELDTHIHHIDKNVYNHKLSNLVALCRTCHLGVHKGTICLDRLQDRIFHDRTLQ